jgi:hypothetical protein
LIRPITTESTVQAVGNLARTLASPSLTSQRTSNYTLTSNLNTSNYILTPNYILTSNQSPKYEYLEKLDLSQRSLDFRQGIPGVGSALSAKN